MLASFRVPFRELRERYPDLADMVVEEELTLTGARAEARLSQGGVRKGRCAGLFFCT